MFEDVRTDHQSVNPIVLLVLHVLLAIDILLFFFSILSIIFMVIGIIISILIASAIRPKYMTLLNVTQKSRAPQGPAQEVYLSCFQSTFLNIEAWTPQISQAASGSPSTVLPQTGQT